MSRNSRKRRRKKKENNFRCFHLQAHNNFCNIYLQFCNKNCKYFCMCGECRNYHIPMGQEPCKNCVGLEKYKQRNGG